MENHAVNTIGNALAEQVTGQVEIGISDSVATSRHKPYPLLNEPIARVWWKLNEPWPRVAWFIKQLFPLWDKTIEGHPLQYDLQLVYHANDGFFEVPTQAASRFYQALEELVLSLGFKVTLKTDIRQTRDGSKPPRLLCVLASEVKLERVVWLWPNRLVMGAVNGFVGLPDVGKSTVALDVAAKITTGEDFYDQQNPFGRPRKVVILATEDSAATTIVPRLKAAGAKLENAILVQAITLTGDEKRSQRMLALDTDIEAVSARIAEDPEIALVIFDPLASYLGKAKKNREEDMRQILESLDTVAKENRICVLVLEHLNKNPDQQSAIHRIAGSQAMSAVPRALWLLAREPKEDDSGIQGESGTEGDEANKSLVRLMVCIKLNLTSEKEKQGLTFMFASKDVDLNDGKLPVPTPVIAWLGKTTQEADNVVQGVRKKKPGPEARKTKDAKEYIAKTLAAGARPSKEIIDTLKGMGISYDIARSAQEQLGVKPHKRGSHWWWELPKKTKANPPF